MNNKLFKIVCVILSVLLLLPICGCDFSKNHSEKEVESVAVDFVESILEGDEKNFIKLIHPDRVQQLMSNNGYQTEEILQYALKKTLDAEVEIYKEKYGKKWKYEISVIDSYAIDAPAEYSNYEFAEVFLKVEHEGTKFLFFKETGLDEIKIQTIKFNGKWYVFSNAYGYVWY